MPRHNPKQASYPSKRSQGSSSTNQATTNKSQLPDSIRTDPSLIHLDGRTLEGGGQLVRVALTLSALTRIPIHIYHIRGRRSGHSSGKGGGLKSSHLAAVEFLAAATAAKTQGALVGSTELVFEPGRERQAWRERGSTNGQDRVGESYEIRLDKPGSVWLIVQAILPYLLFSSSAHVPSIELVILGGTNVPKSMSGEYVKQVMCPMLAKIGLPSIDVDIRRRGWTHGRAIQIGEVAITVRPLERGAKLPAFGMKDRGAITKITISVLAGTESTRSALIAETTQTLNERFPTLTPTEVEIVLDEDSADPKRVYLLLVAHTSNGFRLGRDWLLDEKIKSPLDDSQIELLARKMAQRVTDELGSEIAHGACVDEYMRDQLVVFETLAQGRSFVNGGVDSGHGSLHTQTCRWVVEQVLGGQASFEGAGGERCTGVGFAAGENYEGRTAGENRTGRVDLGAIAGSDQLLDGELA